MLCVRPFTPPDLLNHLITSEQYTTNQDVMMQIIDVVAAVVKEEIEALQQCCGNVALIALIHAQADAVANVQQDFQIIFSFLPTLLHQEYINPILTIPDILQCLVQQLQKEESIAKANPPIGVKRVLSMLLDGFFAQLRSA